MRVRTSYWTATAFAVAAVASLIASYVAFHNGGIEGAYFNRHVEAAAYAYTPSEWWYPWLGFSLFGGAIAFAIAAIVVALLARHQRTD